MKIEVEIVVQINGKVGDEVKVSVDFPEAEATKLALARERIQEQVGTRMPKRVIFVPGRLINIVVG